MSLPARPLTILLLCLTMLAPACGGCDETDAPINVRPGGDMEVDLGGGEEDMAPDVAGPAAVASVVVTPGEVTVEVGDAVSFVAAVSDADGAPITDRRIEWTTSNIGVGRLDGLGNLVTEVPGTATIAATVERVRGEATLTVTPLVVAQVALTPSLATLNAGDTLQLQHAPTNKDGKPVAQRGVTWRSSAPEVATVNGAGFVVASTPGQTRISAEVDGVMGVADITVSDVPVAAVRFVSADPLIIELEQDVAARVKVEDDQGVELLNRPVTWSTVDPLVATVGSAGLVRGVGLGMTELVATVEGVEARAVVEVVPQPVTGMLLRPDGTTLREGETVQLVATLLNRAGQPLMGRPVAWRSLNPAVASIDADGLVTARSPGQAQLEAECEGVIRAVSAQVISRVDRVEVAPATVTLTLTLPNQEAAQLMATPRSATDSPLVRPVTWISAQPLIATVSATGLVQAVAPGVAEVRATSEGVTGIAQITVLPPPVSSVAVSPQITSIFVGQTAQLNAEPRAFNNMPLTGRQVTWATSDPLIATVDAAGLVTAVSRGRVTITATSEGQSGSAPVVVSAVWTHIRAGVDRTCGISSGVSYCWGRNTEGSLGINDVAISTTQLPATVFGGPSFVQLSMRGLHTCALDDLSRAWCWGWNATSQLGDGGQQRRPAPTLVSTAQTFSAIYAGGTHTCALDLTGRAWCWGDNSYGQLGDDTSADRDMPVMVGGGRVFSRLTTGGNHTCGVEAVTDKLLCWGRNDVGQLGTDLRDAGTGALLDADLPTEIGGALRFSQVAAGSDHTCALDLGGQAWCWGDNSDGKLGDMSQTQRSAPTLVTTAQRFTHLVAGSFHTCGKTSAGALWCWGANNNGQLGTGALVGSLVPAAVGGGLTFSDLTAGSLHTCGVASTGAAYCWGYNLFGSLGEGTTQDKRLPFPVVLP